MNPLLDPHNLHRRDGREAFLEQDPTLRRMRGAALQYRSPLIRQLAEATPGIYTLGGGRQVGKTTLVKQCMAALLRSGTPPESILYLTGEVIRDEHELLRELTEPRRPSDPGRQDLEYVFIDEVTYVRDWDIAIKYLADSGALDNVVLLLTGSDLILIQDALKRLPGRRGRAGRVDFHYHPLDFLEFCKLRGRVDKSEVGLLAAAEPAAPLQGTSDTTLGNLYQELDDYLITGGYLTAINDLEQRGRVAAATLRVYSDWIRGDMLRLNRSETYLREVLQAVLVRYGSQITWNSLARDLSIDHPKTVSDYCAILERMGAAVVISALREDRLNAAPKKAKKLYFQDPFIHHSVKGFLESDTKDLERGDVLEDQGLVAGLVESLFPLHSRRFAPTYYIKSKSGEVDSAYVRDGRFWPIEVKWQSAPRPKDLKTVARYANGLVAARTNGRHQVDGVPIRPIPAVLLRLCAMASTKEGR